MPDESRSSDVEKLLADEKAIESRKQALIADLLKQKEAAMQEFDDRLAKLGYHSGKGKRNHHRKAASADTPKPKAKS